MRRSAFDETRDQHTADHLDRRAPLMCAAHGCPNRWTVDAGHGRLCSAHAWAEPESWPDITYAQQWDETERARMRGEPTPPASRNTSIEAAIAPSTGVGKCTQQRTERIPSSVVEWAHAKHRRIAAARRAELCARTRAGRYADSAMGLRRLFDVELPDRLVQRARGRLRLADASPGDDLDHAAHGL